MGPGHGGNFFPPMMNEQLPYNQFFPNHDTRQMAPQMNFGDQNLVNGGAGGGGLGLGGRSVGDVVPDHLNGGMGGIDAELMMKIDLQVPSDPSCIGFIMGPKGAKIREIEAASGCKVTVPRLPAKVSR